MEGERINGTKGPKQKKRNIYFYYMKWNLFMNNCRKIRNSLKNACYGNLFSLPSKWIFILPFS
jgi:hypothetical protein